MLFAFFLCKQVLSWQIGFFLSLTFSFLALVRAIDKTQARISRLHAERVSAPSEKARKRALTA